MNEQKYDELLDFLRERKYRTGATKQEKFTCIYISIQGHPNKVQIRIYCSLQLLSSI